MLIKIKCYIKRFMFEILFLMNLWLFYKILLFLSEESTEFIKINLLQHKVNLVTNPHILNLHYFCYRSSPDDGPKSGRKY